MQPKTLTNKEKIRLCSGATQWDTKDFPNAGIPSVKVADGPHGLRKTRGKGDNLGLTDSHLATCFPSESLLAASFDTDLAEKTGSAIAAEAASAGVCTFLGPGANIQRNPLCGRNFEYFSEDPYLAGHMAAAYIRGAEATGVGTCLKHFACNNRESHRMTSDSRVDERALREIYLTPFEIAVKNGKPSSVMSAYNLLNGVYCSENRRLLTGILREEWGFGGLIMTDWGALNDRTEAFRAGCDLAMPGGSGYGEAEALSALHEGTLSPEALDACAARVARFAAEKSAALRAHPKTYDPDAHHALAETIAAESAVLLKNDAGFLPIVPQKTLVIGAMAEHFRFQGSGSSKVHAIRTESFLAHFGAQDYLPGYLPDGSGDDALLREAMLRAKTAKNVVVVAGLPERYETEGFDRQAMALPAGMDRLIEAVASANPNTAVVLICGCPVETPWADRVKSILWMGLSGQAGAAALAKLLTGEANPCGRLAESWPLTYEDVPCTATWGKDRCEEYTESVYVGYRYYEKANVPVRFPFGHGLSYTTFSYSDLRCDGKTATVVVTNTGDRAGKDAVLLYAGMTQDGMHRPLRELKGFRKVFLLPGQSAEISFPLDERTFALWDGGWKTPRGIYTLQTGSLSIDYATGTDEKRPKDASWYAAPHGAPNREDWLRLPRIADKAPSREGFSVNSTAGELAAVSPFTRFALRCYDRVVAKLFGRGSADHLWLMTMANECPLRAVQIFTGLKGNAALRVAAYAERKRRKRGH
ncbi:MAG: glycoside hydrolase family 3 C-terminal domain-containing protein [Clostridia bacterium]|nr:glycoside hydrolase family 3 C-terminal domain-containing protein [Clostridia bacterium]